MKVTIRDVDISDIGFIYKLRNDPEIREKMFSTGGISYPEHMEFWKRRLDDERVSSYVVILEDDPVGMVRLDPYQNGFEVGIIIDKKYQGEGIASKALELVKEKAATKGVKKIFARVKPDNKPSISLFEKSGFEVGQIVYELELEG